eukprot:gene17669-23258_t
MAFVIEQRNQDASIYVGNLDEKVTEETLWELMLQCGPVVNVHMPKDKVTGKHMFYGFVEFRTEDDAEYALKIMNMVKLYGKTIKLNKTSQDKKIVEVGANLFIGNLDPEVDEKLLYDTFSAFGGIEQTPKIMRDPDTNISKGYGFVSYDSFESSDLAIECMNGQYLCNRSIVVQYAFKKDTPGERHGSQAERLLAASRPTRFKPHTIFSGGNGDTTVQLGNTLANMAATASMQQALEQQQIQMHMQMGGYNPLLQMQMNAYQMSGQMPMPPLPPNGLSMPGYMYPTPVQPMIPQPPPPMPMQHQYAPPPPPMIQSYSYPAPPPPPPM